MSLTRAQRLNLAKLADYLEGLPENYQHFEMRDYMGLSESNAVLLEYARHNGGVAKCGTAACAVGHGPAAGILFRPCDFERGYGDVTQACWENYSTRFTPRGMHEPEFDWAFGSLWSSADNHHWGAAARIRYLIKHGSPPAGYRFAHERAFVKTYREFDKRHAVPEGNAPNSNFSTPPQGDAEL